MQKKNAKKLIKMGNKINTFLGLYLRFSIIQNKNSHL